MAVKDVSIYQLAGGGGAVTFKLRLVVKPSELKTGRMIPSCTCAPKAEDVTLSKTPHRTARCWPETVRSVGGQDCAALQVTQNQSLPRSVLSSSCSC